MFDPRKLADVLKPPNWAAGGTLVAILLLFVSAIYAFNKGDNPAQSVQITYQLALVIAGLIGLPLAIWRSWTAHIQALTAQRQLEGFQKQLALLEAGAEADRLQKGTELLESEKLVVRIAGIAILRSIAVQPEHKFRTEAFRVLEAFARITSEGTEEHVKQNPSQTTRSPQDFSIAFETLMETVKTSNQEIGSLTIRGLRFRQKTFDDDSIGGMIFIDCHFHDCTIGSDSFTIFNNCTFRDCTVHFEKFELNDYKLCRFMHCDIEGSPHKNVISSCTFANCKGYNEKDNISEKDFMEIS